MTPWLFSVAIEAAEERRDNDHDRAAWTMWHGAVLTRVKTMPPLKRFLAKYKKPMKGIDEGAIIAKLKAYQGKRDFHK